MTKSEAAKLAAELKAEGHRFVYDEPDANADAYKRHDLYIVGGIAPNGDEYIHLNYDRTYPTYL